MQRFYVDALGGFVDTIMQLDASMVAERLRDYTPSNYLYLYGLMKGVALATAAFVCLTFLDDRTTLFPRLVLWFASIGVVLITHTTAARGVLLASHRYNVLDTIFPLAMGVVETMLFAILQPSEKNPLIWHHWALLFTIHAMLAVGIIQNRLRLTVFEDFHESLHPLAADLRSWLYKDRTGGASCEAAFFGLWLLTAVWQGPRELFGSWVDIVIGFLALLVGIGVVFQADKQRGHIADFVANLTNTIQGG